MISVRDAVKEVRAFLYGGAEQKPTTLEQIEQAIRRGEVESETCELNAKEHTQHAEFIASELALEDHPEFSPRLEQEQAAANDARERRARIGTALTGLYRRRTELLARQTEAERAAFEADIKRQCKQFIAGAGKIDEHMAALVLLWSEQMTRAQLLQAALTGAAGRELAITMPTFIALRPREDRPSVRVVALNVAATAFRAIGLEQEAL